MTRYASGRRAEWAVRDALLKAGAVHVMRSAGSHGEADLMAIFPEFVWCIQVKTSKPTTAEIEKVRKASSFSKAARWALVWWDRGCGRTVTSFRGGRPWKIDPPGLQSDKEA